MKQMMRGLTKPQPVIFGEDGYLTELSSAVLEAYWHGMTALECATYHGEDPMIVAAMMDTFRKDNW